jgi:putative ABC transport system ATP-binding protein
LMPVLTAYENVELPLLLTSLSRKQRAEHVKTALRIVGLAERMDHYPRQLSGGQEQRVAIARALVNDSVLLLADEPTGNLDRATAASIAALLLELQQQEQTMLVVVTHSLELAGMLHRRLELNNGKLL